MCKSKTIEYAPGHIKVVCAKTGKELTVRNEYGAYCEDMCNFDEDKDAIDGLLRFFEETFGPMEIE